MLARDLLGRLGAGRRRPVAAVPVGHLRDVSERAQAELELQRERDPVFPPVPAVVFTWTSQQGAGRYPVCRA